MAGNVWIGYITKEMSGASWDHGPVNYGAVCKRFIKVDFVNTDGLAVRNIEVPIDFLLGLLGIRVQFL